MASLTAVLEAARNLALPATKPIVLLLFAAFGCAMVARAAGAGRASTPNKRLTPPQPDRTPSERVTRLVSIALPIAALVMLARIAVTRSGVLAGDAAVAILWLTLVTRRTAIALPIRAWVSSAAVVMLVFGLAWWDFRASAPDAAHLFSFATIFALIFWGLRLPSIGTTRTSTTPMVMAAIALGAVLTIDMSSYDAPSLDLELMAHHWGAYITGSAEHVLAGLRPYVDVAVAIRTGSDADHRRRVPPHRLLGRASLADRGVDSRHGVAPAAHDARGSRRTQRRHAPWMAAVVAFAAIFLWPGFAPIGSALVATPSSSALRYLPVVIVAYLAFANRPRWAAIAAVPAIWWAPEVAMMAMGVLGVAEAARVGFMRATFRCGVLLGGAYAALAIGLRIAYGVWPQPDVFTEYIAHVPSPMAIDPTSAFLLLIATFGVAAWVLGDRSSDALTRRRDLIAIALLFVTTTYYFGRSHPNSVCDLMPFVALVAFRALARTRSVALSTAIAAGMAASVAALTLSSWAIVPLRHGFSPGLSAPIDAITQFDPDLQVIRGSIPNPDHLGIADFTARRDRWPNEAIWTPLDPLSLWTFEPDARRQLYVMRAAARASSPRLGHRLRHRARRMANAADRG